MPENGSVTGTCVSIQEKEGHILSLVLFLLETDVFQGDDGTTELHSPLCKPPATLVTEI